MNKKLKGTMYFSRIDIVYSLAVNIYTKSINGEERIIVKTPVLEQELKFTTDCRDFENQLNTFIYGSLGVIINKTKKYPYEKKQIAYSQLANCFEYFIKSKSLIIDYTEESEAMMSQWDIMGYDEIKMVNDDESNTESYLYILFTSNFHKFIYDYLNVNFYRIIDGYICDIKNTQLIPKGKNSPKVIFNPIINSSHVKNIKLLCNQLIETGFIEAEIDELFNFFNNKPTSKGALKLSGRPLHLAYFFYAIKEESDEGSFMLKIKGNIPWKKIRTIFNDPFKNIETNNLSKFKRIPANDVIRILLNIIRINKS